MLCNSTRFEKKLENGAFSMFFEDFCSFKAQIKMKIWFELAVCPDRLSVVTGPSKLFDHPTALLCTTNHLSKQGVLATF